MVGKICVVEDSKPRSEVDGSTSTAKSDREIHLFHSVSDGKRDVPSAFQEVAATICGTAAYERD
jgi:hypothetical protein